MVLTSQALLGFLLLPLWPSPSLALLRHSWELFGGTLWVAIGLLDLPTTPSLAQNVSLGPGVQAPSLQTRWDTPWFEQVSPTSPGHSPEPLTLVTPQG